MGLLRERHVSADFPRVISCPYAYRHTPFCGNPRNMRVRAASCRVSGANVSYARRLKDVSIVAISASMALSAY